jgi:hypothetical protein
MTWPRHISWRTGNRCRPTPSPNLIEAKKKADRQIAHITSDRRDLNLVPGIEHRWKVDVIEGELRGILSQLLQHVPEGLFDPIALAGLREIQSGEASYFAASPAATPNHMETHLGFTATTSPPTEVGTICPKQSFGGTTD